MRTEFIAAIEADQTAFGLELAVDQIARLADYYDLVIEYNPLLHLAAPCSPEEFAVRHVLESLTLLEHLEPGAHLADVGPGGGFPSIPCLLVRDDLLATLIESKQKKADFLAHAAAALAIDKRVTVIARQFSETAPGRATAVTCRALDRFVEHLPRLLRWAGRRKLLLFGGPNLAAALKAQGRTFVQRLMPLSEQRYLFVIPARSGS